MHRQPRVLTPFLLLLLLLGAVAPASAQPALSGSQIRIDAVMPDVYRDLAIAADPAGGLTVAWIEEWTGAEPSTAIRARRFDRDGKPLGPAFRVAWSPESANGCLAVAAGRGGKSFAVWTAPARRFAGIYGRLLDAAGRPEGKILRLDFPGFLADHIHSCHVVASAAGIFTVVWGGAGGGTEDLWARRVLPAGQPGLLARIPRSARFSLRTITSAAMSRRGELALAGLGRRTPDDRPEVFLQRMAADWRPLRGVEVRVPTPLGWRAGPQGPAVAFGADETLALLWVAEPTASERLPLLLARRATAAGSWAGPAVRIDEGSVAISAAALAADPGGGFLAVWFHSNRGGVGRRIEPTGPLGPIFELDPENQGAPGIPHAVAQGTGRFAAVWGSAYGILGQRFASASPGRLQLQRKWSVALEGSGKAGLVVSRRDGNRGAVSVSYSVVGLDAAPGADFDDAGGTVTFANGDSLPKRIEIPLWDDSQAEPDESFQVVLHDPEGGALLGPVTTATVEIRDDDVASPLLAGAGPVISIASRPFEGFSVLSEPHVARRPAGGFIAAWQNRQRVRPFETRSNVSFALFDTNGQLAGKGGPSGVSEEDEDEPRIVPQPDGGFFVLWASLPRSDGEPGRRFAQRFDAAGGSLGDPFELPSFTALAEPLPLRAAPGVGGGFVVVGQRRSGRSVQLFAERYDGAGRRRREEIPVNEHPLLDLFEVPFAVASDAAGGFVVVWRRIPQPGLPGGIIARRFSPSGVPRGREILAGGRGELVSNPEVAVASDGAFAVVWDAVRDRRVISARWFDGSGTPLGDEIQVSSTSGSHTLPLAAFGSGGELLAGWWSERGFEGQLYASPGVRAGSPLVLDAGNVVRIALAATAEGWIVAGISIHGSSSGEDVMELHARIFVLPEDSLPFLRLPG